MAQGYAAGYAASEPAREEIDALQGPALIEFGSPWCGWCRRAEPLIADALAAHPTMRHIRIADASARGVKLWPTLVFLRDGKETARLVRPHGAGAIREALSQIDR